MNIEATYTNKSITGNKGTCPRCFGTFSVKYNGMVHHGHKKSPHDKFMHGSCDGVNKRPLETTDADATMLLWAVGFDTNREIAALEEAGKTPSRLIRLLASHTAAAAAKIEAFRAANVVAKDPKDEIIARQAAEIEELKAQLAAIKKIVG